MKSYSLKTIIIMPAYNSSKTLEKTYNDIPKDVVDGIILADNASQDDTVEISKKLGIKTIAQIQNKGYGGNQKTCYIEALKDGADIVVMLHPDYQYDPKKIPELIEPIIEGKADMVMGSRLLDGKTLEGGMPLYKFLGNRVLTLIENAVLGLKLSECHTGLRAYNRKFLTTIPFLLNSDDFVFDTEVIAQAASFKFRIAEISVPTRYFKEASSVDFKTSLKYGVQTILTLLKFIVNELNLVKIDKFRKKLPDILGKYHADDVIYAKIRCSL